VLSRFIGAQQIDQATFYHLFRPNGATWGYKQLFAEDAERRSNHTTSRTKNKRI
jgi:hypothetical protein